VKVAGLFAGIGGLELGLSQAGHEAVVFSEIWEPAQTVLKDKFPDVPLEPDVSDIIGLPTEVELVTAGFPCQDLSQAGRTAGIEGSRSGLVGHVFRLLEGRQVPWVVLENVSFMLHLDQGRGMRFLIESFEALGYRWAYRVVNSLAFLPQRRERVILVATTTDVDPASVILVDDESPKQAVTSLESEAHGFYWTEGVRGLGWAPDAVPTLKNGSTIGIPSPPAIMLPSGKVVTPAIGDAERLQGFPENWTIVAEHGHRKSARWSLVGNAVTVPVARWLGQRLVTPGTYDRGRDRQLDDSARWPRAARFDGNRRFAVEIGMYPVWQDRDGLNEFLRHAGKPLSVRATQGFLNRTDRSTLRFVPGFLERVRGHLSDMMTSVGGQDDAVPAE
jgi:DNA (cytosine-5)-methyltransferase 1